MNTLNTLQTALQARIENNILTLSENISDCDNINRLIENLPDKKLELNQIDKNELCYLDNDTLIISGKPNCTAWKLMGFMEQASFEGDLLEIAIKENRNAKFSITCQVQGRLSLSSTVYINTIIKWHEEDNLWEIQYNEKTTNDCGLQLASELFSSNDLIHGISDFLDATSVKFRLNECNAIFTPNGEMQCYTIIEMAPVEQENFTIIENPKVKFDHFTVALHNSYNDYYDAQSSNLGCLLEGGISFPDSKLKNMNFSIDIYNPYQLWTICIKPDLNIPTIEELGAFLGYEINTFFKPVNTDQSQIVIDSLEIGFIPSKLSLQNVKLTLTQEGEWTLVPDFLAVKINELALSLNHNESKWEPEASLEGSVFLGDAEILLMASLPSMNLAGSLNDDTPVKLQSLLDHLKIPLDSLPPEMSEVAISEMNFFANGNPDNINFSANVRIDNLFQIDNLLGSNLSVDVDFLKLGIAYEQNAQKKMKAHMQGGMSLYLDSKEKTEANRMAFEIAFEYNEKFEFAAVAKNIKLSKIVEYLLNTELPQELPDVVIETLLFTIDSKKNVTIKGKIDCSVEEKEQLELGEQDMLLGSLEFNFKKSSTSIDAQIKVSGKNIPKIDELDAQIKEYHMFFDLNRNNETKNTDWKLGGELHIEAFERLMTFKACASSLKKEQKLTFEFDSEKLLVQKAYFNNIEGTNPDEILKQLNGGVMPQDKHINLPDNLESIETILGNAFNSDQKKEISLVLKKIKRANEPLIQIPDVFNENKPLCTIEPKKFAIELKRKEGKFESFAFSIVSDFTLYSNLNNQSELFAIKDGTLSSAYDKSANEFKLTYTAEDCEIKPLNIVALVPGIADGIKAIYNDELKEEAFLNMLSIHFNEAHFIKKGKNYDLKGGIKLSLNDGLKTVSEDLYNTIESIFPSTGTERSIGGNIAYTTEKGLLFELTNNNGIEIPNLFAEVLKGIPEELKQKLNDVINLDQVFDIGESYLLLEKIRLTINKEITLSATVAFGLPSKLNDRLLASSQLNGIINTYDRKLLKQKSSEEGKKNKEDEPTGDNLSRVTLSFGTDGISGQVDKLDIINMNKLNEVTKDLTSFFIQEDDKIILDFDLLASDLASSKTESKYGKISIDKPKFKLDIKTGAFSARGGFDILSEHLRLPVRSVVQKLAALLPLSDIEAATVKAFTDQLTDGITLKSLKFIKDNKLNLDDVEGYFRDLIPQSSANESTQLIPAEFKNIVENYSEQLITNLPTRFKDYLSIEIPEGLHFKIEIPADKSIAFQLWVPDKKEQEDNDFSDCIQLLVPDFSTGTLQYWYGIRLRKIVFGTALFNQAFRLDLSAEIDQFNILEMGAGLGINELLKFKPDLDFVLPDPEEFCLTFEAKDLMLIIFVLTTPIGPIPIPVPLFYNKLFFKNRSIVGGGTELNIELPAPALDLSKAFKELSNCVAFFKTKESALPVPSHALLQTKEEAKNDGLLKPFEVGPFNIELPGMFGYQKEADRKSKIVIGITDRFELNALDMVHLVANAFKASVLSSITNEEYKIPIGESGQSEFPVNYLVKYLPVSKRIGRKEIMLFELFDINFVWTISTPNEFSEKVYSLLVDKQEEIYLPYKADETQNGTELLKIISNATLPYKEIKPDEQGVVLFFKGAIELGSVGLDIALGTAISESSGLASGIEFNAYIANVFHFHLSGALKVNIKPEDAEFTLMGNSSLKLWDNYVMQGSFTLSAGTNPVIEFSGLLDLFPEKDSIIKLYTGAGKGNKSPIEGLINKGGISFNAGIHLEIGSFYLGGTTHLIVNKNQNSWETQLDFFGNSLNLSVKNENKLLSLNGKLKKAIEIGPEISFSAESSEVDGPSALIEIGLKNKLPNLEKFQFDGRAFLFGNYSKAKINIEKEKFIFTIDTEILGIRSWLVLEGNDFSDIASYKYNGTLDLSKFNTFIEDVLDPFHIKNKEAQQRLEKISTDINNYNRIKEKQNYIEELNQKYKSQLGYVYFAFIVPPLSHISYWVNCTNPIQKYFYYKNPTCPRWTQQDVHEVEIYCRYMRELGTPYNPPKIDLVGWIDSIFNTIVSVVNTVENQVLENIKQIANGLDYIIKGLKIETRLSHEINVAINNGLTEVQKINNALATCIKNKEMIVKVNKIECINLSISDLKSDNFELIVHYDFLDKKNQILDIHKSDLTNPLKIIDSIHRRELGNI